MEVLPHTAIVVGHSEQGEHLWPLTPFFGC